jgi:autotransporter-associated beta strand protein
MSRSILKTRKLSVLSAASAAALMGILSTPGQALAANKTWDGGGADSFWQTGVNWDVDTAPAPADSLFFAGSTQLLNSNDFAAGTAFSGITFNSGAGAFVLGGNSISLGGNVTNSSTTLQTVGLSMDLGAAARTFTMGTGGGNITVAGPITSTGAAGITTAGAGTLLLSNSNSFTGTNTIVAGTAVQLGNAFGLGAVANALALNGGTLDLNGNTVNIGNLNLSAVGTISSATAGTLIFSAQTGGSQYQNVRVSGATTLIFNGGAGGNSNALGGSQVVFGNGAIGFQNQTTAGVRDNSIATTLGPTGALLFNGGGQFQNSTAVTLAVGNTVIVNGTGNMWNWQQNGAVALTTNGPWVGSGAISMTQGFAPTCNLNGDMTNFQGTMIFVPGGAATGTNFATISLNNTTTIGAGKSIWDLQSGSAVAGGQPILQWGGAGAVARIVPLGDLNSTGNVGNGNLVVRNGVAGSAVTFQVGSLNLVSTYAGQIIDGPTTGTVAIDKVGTGTWSLTGTSNTYTGGTTIDGGALKINNTAALGVAAASVTINNGELSALTSFSDPRSININSANSAIGVDAGQTYTLTTGITGTGALNKVDPGTLVLAGTHAYAGATQVTGGLLSVSGTLSNSPVTVSSGGAVGGTGTLGSLLTLAGSGAQLNLQDNALGTINLNNGLTLANGSQLTFDISTTGTDQVKVNGGAFSFTGNSTINFNSIGGLTQGHYTIMTFPSGSFPGVGNLTLATPPLGYSIQFDTPTATSLSVFVQGVSPPNIAYWSGDRNDGIWSSLVVSTDTNWATDASLATDTLQLPASNTEVNFNNITTATSTTLGANLGIKNLIFGKNTVNSASVVIADSSHTLGLFDPLGAGIKVVGGSATNTISVGTLQLNGATQHITNNSSGTLTISSIIASPTFGITLDGSGPVLLSGNNIFAGGTTLSSGKLIMGSARALGTGPLAINGGTLDINAFSPTVVGPVSGVGGVITNNGATGGTVTFNGGTYLGVVSNGTGSGTVALNNASGVLALGPANTYSGITSVTGGIIQAPAASSVGTSGTIQIGNGTFDVSGTYSSSPNLVLTNVASTVAVEAGQTYTFGGALAGAGSFNKGGLGTLVLATDNGGYNGNIVLNGGVTQLASTFGLGSAQISTGTTSVASGATLDLNGQFIGEVFSSFAGVLTNSSTSLAIVGVDNDATSAFGQIGGSSSFTVNGIGDIFLDRVSGAAGLQINASGSNTVTLGGGLDNANLTLNVTSGTVSLAKTGTTATLHGANTLTVAGGTVKIDSSGSGSFELGGGTFLVNSGTFDINGTTQSTRVIDGTLTTGLVTNNNGSIGTLILGAQSSTVSGSYAGVIANGTGQLSVTLIGTGTQTLGGTSTYTGNTNVSGGVLAVTGVLASSGNVNVNTSATAAGELRGTGSVGKITLAASNGTNIARVNPGTSVTGSVGTLTANSLALNGGDLRFDLVSPGASDAINVTGSTNFAAASTVTIEGHPATGVYTLISSGSPITYGVMPTLQNDSSVTTIRPSTLVADTTSDPTKYQVNLTSGTLSLQWSGTTNSTWDLATTANFTNPSLTADKFFNFDSVNFGNGPTNRTVTLAAAALTPTSITANNTAGNDYTISGLGTISGTTGFTKSNGGKVTISLNSNSYTGPTVINGGTLEVATVANGLAISSIGAGTTDSSNLVINGGTLRVIGTGAETTNHDIAIGINGGSIDSSGGGLTLNGNYVLAGAGPRTITFTGTNAVTTNNILPIADQDPVTGKTTVVYGSVGLAAPTVNSTLNATNTYTGGTIINPGVQMRVNNNSTFGPGSITMNGGQLYFASVATPGSVLTNDMFIAGGTTSVIRDERASFSFSGNLTGSGTLLTTVLAFNPNQVWAGDTSAFAGTLDAENGATTSTYALGFAGATSPMGVPSGHIIVNGFSATGTARLAYFGALPTATVRVGELSGNAFGQVANNSAATIATFEIGNLNTSTTFAGAVIDGAGTTALTKVGTGTLSITGSSTYTGVTTVKAGKLIMGLASQGPILTGAGGADIQGGKLVLDYTGAASLSATGNAVNTALTAGFASGFTTGQIRSSTLAASQGLGWVDDGTSRVTIAKAYYGDANLDGTVNILDFNSLAAQFGQTGKVWAQGDFNYDGTVNLLDLNAVATNFGQVLSAPLPSSPVASLGALVPEPASISLLAAAGLLGIRRRHKK